METSLVGEEIEGKGYLFYFLYYLNRIDKLLFFNQCFQTMEKEIHNIIYYDIFMCLITKWTIYIILYYFFHNLVGELLLIYN